MKNQKAVYIKTALSGITIGLIIFMIYLFNERDKKAAEDYRNYYQPLAAAIENFKTNLARIYMQVETDALQTGEIEYGVRMELAQIVKANINECDKNIKKLNSDFVPLSAKKTKNDMVLFFARARGLLISIEKTINGGSSKKITGPELESIENELELISHIQISGYTYYSKNSTE